MNNEVRAIINEALDGSKELEEKLAEFHNKIEKNNKFLYLEIYKQLIDQFNKKPISYMDYIGLTINFRSIVFASDEDKKIMESLGGIEKAGIGLYNSPTQGEILVDVKKVIDELYADGFPKDKSVIDYTFAGWNDEERQNDNVLKININLERFRSIMGMAVEEKNGEKTSPFLA